MRSVINKARVTFAFDMIAKVNRLSIMSLDEMEDVVCRSLSGEFDKEIFEGQNVLVDVSISTTKDKLNET